MFRHSATAYAPATVANLGVGFDILGLALASPGDTVTAERIDRSPGVHIKAITGDNGKLPRDPERNTACVAARYVLDRVAPGEALALTLEKGLPLASGLGSSSASAVAGAVAANAVLGEPFSREELLPACVEAEAVVSGRHADNVAPALLGGIVLVTGVTPADIHGLPVPDDLFLAVVTPAVEVPTAEARRVLPEHVPLKTMIHQTAQVACLIHALHTGNFELLCEAVSQDRVVEPARAHLMPHLEEVRQSALASGAGAVIISGAGPTLAALCNNDGVARRVASAMKSVYQQHGLAANAQATAIAKHGARIIRISEHAASEDGT